MMVDGRTIGTKVLDRWFVILLVVFIYLQPVIDIATSLMVRFTETEFTAGILMRMAVLILVVSYALFAVWNKESKYLLAYLILFALYASVFLVNILLNKGQSYLFTELKSFVKMIYFPLMLAALFHIFRHYRPQFSNKHLILPGIIYVILILAAIVTKTEFLSYGHGKLGGSGWFYAPNEIGAILSILFPIYVYALIQKPKNWLYWLGLPVFIFVCLWIGTKAPFLAVIMTLGSAAVISFLRVMIAKNKGRHLIVSACSFFILIIVLQAAAFLPSGQNIKLHMFTANVTSIKDFFRWNKPNGLNFGEASTTSQPNESQPTEQQPTDPEIPEPDTTNVIFSSRDKYLASMLKNYQDDPLWTKMIGKGYILKVGDSKFTYVSVEMDFHDIFFRLGILGFMLYYIPYILLLASAVFLFFRRFMTNIQKNKVVGYSVAVMIALGQALIAGHVFTAPSVSLYAALILVLLLISLREDASVYDQRANSGY